MIPDEERLSVERYRFIARGDAIGCGRPPLVGPLTKEQEEYVQQYTEWCDWKERTHDVDAAGL